MAESNKMNLTYKSGEQMEQLGKHIMLVRL